MVAAKTGVQDNILKDEVKKTEARKPKEEPNYEEKGRDNLAKQPLETKRESLSDRKSLSRRSRGSAPDFIIKPRSRSVLEGSNARFTCTVNGDPEPSLAWFFDGEVFAPDERRELKVRNGIATVVITNACAEDIGDYKVVASNELGEISHIATLKIDGLEKPERKEKTLEPAR